MLLSARGNSGVILSQVFRGLADEVLGRPVVDLPGSDHPRSSCSTRSGWPGAATGERPGLALGLPTP